MTYSEVQDPPFMLDIELTEGCNLRCDFCGIQAIRETTGDYKCMTVETAKAISDGVRAAGWTSRFELSGHGEPSMNPHKVDIVRALRAGNKNQILFTSNGIGFLKDTTEAITAMFDAGLNILLLDDYAHVTIVDKLLERYAGDIPIHTYPNDGLEYNPYRRKKPGTKMIVVMPDLAQTATGVHSTVNNRAGQGAPPSDVAEGKRCVKPFRDMVIRWDGSVNSCCNDYRGVIKVANVNKTTTADIWNGQVFKSLRRYLYNGMRDFAPCKGCDFVGMRPGLLPDKLGKETTPLPTAEDKQVMDRAIAGDTFTKIVWRDWEKHDTPNSGSGVLDTGTAQHQGAEGSGAVQAVEP